MRFKIKKRTKMEHAVLLATNVALWWIIEYCIPYNKKYNIAVKSLVSGFKQTGLNSN